MALNEKQLVIAILKEKLEKATGKKVVFESKNTEKELKIKALTEKLQKLSGKKVVFEDVEKTPEELEEGLFGPSEETVKQNFLKTINAWKSKGVKAPDAAAFNDIMAQAKADKFAGKLGVDANKNVIYRSAKDIKWAGNLGSAGAKGGTAGA